MRRNVGALSVGATGKPSLQREPNDRNQLAEIDGGALHQGQQRHTACVRTRSLTQVPLQEPAAPIWGDGDQGEDDLLKRIAFEHGVPHVAIVPARIQEGGAEAPERGEEGEDDEVVEEEEGEEFVGDLSLPTGLGDVSGVDGHPAEDGGKIEIEQGGDGRSYDALKHTPSRAVGVEGALEGGPHEAEMGEVGKENGDEDVGHNPSDGQESDGEMIAPPPPTTPVPRQIQIVPDDIVLVGRQLDGGTLRTAFTIPICSGVGLFDGFVNRESVRQRLELVRRPHQFLNLALLDLDLLPLRGAVLLGVIGELLHQRLYQVSVLFLQSFEIGDVAPYRCPVCHARDRSHFVIEGERRGKAGDEQGAGVEVRLVFGTAEILPPQPEHRPVVGPQEIAHDQIEQVGGCDVGPEGTAGLDVLRRQSRKDGDVTSGDRSGGGDVDRDQKRGSDDGEGGEDVAHHLGKTQEHHGVEPHQHHQVALFRQGEGL